MPATKHEACVVRELLLRYVGDALFVVGKAGVVEVIGSEERSRSRSSALSRISLSLGVRGCCSESSFARHDLFFTQNVRVQGHA